MNGLSCHNLLSRRLRLGGALVATACMGLCATAQSNYPIDLPTALRLAGARNLDIQIAREKVNEAAANREGALQEFFPWLAVGASYHRRDGVAQAVPAGTISDAHFQSYSPGGTLAAQVNLGDAWYQSLAAKQLFAASSHALEAQRQDSLLNAAMGYFDLAKAYALADVAREAVKVSREYERELHEAVGAGIAFKGDELRVASQSQKYELAREQALEQSRLAAARLARTLHLDPLVELVPQQTELSPLTLFAPNVPADAILAQALGSRPELKESRSMISAARAQKSGAVYGPLVPALGAQVFAGGLGGGPDNGPGTLGPEGDYSIGVAWRIGPGGLFDASRIHSAKARLAQSELSEAKLKDEIATEIVTALARIRSLDAQIDLARTNLALTTETLRLTRARKQYGVGVVLEDLQAQQAVTQSRSDYFTALAEHNKAEYQLSKASGSLGVPRAEPSQ